MNEQSNAIAAVIQLKMQRAVTNPLLGFRFQTSSGFLDLSTLYDARLWLKDVEQETVMELGILAGGLTIATNDATNQPDILMFGANVVLPAVSYLYDLKLFSAEDDYFYAVKGVATVINNVTA